MRECKSVIRARWSCTKVSVLDNGEHIEYTRVDPIFTIIAVQQSTRWGVPQLLANNEMCQRKYAVEKITGLSKIVQQNTRFDE